MTIFDYIKCNYRYLSFFLFGNAIYLLTLLIYGCSLEPMLYALVIHTVFFVIFFFFAYQKEKRRYESLINFDITLDSDVFDFSFEEDMAGKQYQKIIEQLKEQQKKTRNELDREKKEESDFFTLWVHQIKTPIAALQLLLQTDSDNLSEMKSELFKIQGYVDIMLGYLRMENLNSDLSIKHYSLDFLVKQAVKKYTPLFVRSHLSLELGELSYEVLTDEKWLVFVLEQLLSNAIKYTKEGGISIYATKEKEQGRIKTKLMLKDTGIGILPEDLPRIFERAFTGYNGRMDKKASGLGLYLCDSILKKLGHEISIQSVPRKGTCVTILFTENETFT